MAPSLRRPRIPPCAKSGAFGLRDVLWRCPKYDMPKESKQCKILWPLIPCLELFLGAAYACDLMAVRGKAPVSRISASRSL
eukprot:5691328-Pyramimonas_sp.AAC.2